MMMRSMLHYLVLACLLTVTLLWCAGSVEAGRPHAALLAAAAASGQPKPKHGPAEQFLAGHNEARRAVGVRQLSWSPKLQANVSRVVRDQAAKGCGFANLNSIEYGANQLLTSYPVSPAEAVKSWVEGKKYYSYGNNSCTAGHECGTYKQVVWGKTKEVGCAQATCAEGGGTLTICFYNPHGNVMGEKPY